LHLVAYVGDGDGNGSYNNNDAVLITRVLLGADSGLAAYPLVDPVIVADTDGAGFIPADAALQANEAGVGFPAPNLTTPPIPSEVHFRAIPNNVDPSVSLPSDLHVAADGTVTVPVNIDDARPEGSAGLTRADLALTYDPRRFTVSVADVHLGSVLAAGSGWSVVPTIDQASGQIGIALSSSTPINGSMAGSLVTIDFHGHAIGGRIGNPSYGVGRIGNPSYSDWTSIALVASVSPHGQSFTTELEDAQGSFILTPTPTNGFDPRIDSVVDLTSTPATAAASISPVAATTSSNVVQSDDGRPVETRALETINPVAPAVTVADFRSLEDFGSPDNESVDRRREAVSPRTAASPTVVVSCCRRGACDSK
jgi:hypothetical protein